MIISIIVAMDKNRLIGAGNSLPWDIPEDLVYFKEKTMGKPVIMGQKTFESIGCPLKGRTNIVLTRDENFNPPGCITADSIEEALKAAGNCQEVMVAGGASVYKQFLSLADRIYLTLIEEDFEGDVFFPELDQSQWIEKSRIEKKDENQSSYKYSFIVLERNNN